MKIFRTAAGAVILAGLFSFLYAQDAQETVILDTGSLWRCHLTRGSELVRTQAGNLIHIPHTKMFTKKGKGRKAESLLNTAEKPVHSPLPPENWKNLDFNDGSWSLYQGPFGAGKYKSISYWYKSLPLLCLRGAFALEDPETIEELRLSLTVHGGAIIYVNGKELTRIAMPKGRIDMLTPAVDYDKKAFVTPEGDILTMRGPVDQKKYPEHFKARLRSQNNITVPRSMLRKGINVLAIELHRAPAYEVMFMGKGTHMKKDAYTRKKKYGWWCRNGLISLTLAGRGSGILSPSSYRPKGLDVWILPILDRMHPEYMVIPGDGTPEIVIAGSRNGVFSGQAVVCSAKPIQGLTVEVSGLKGVSNIPSSAVSVRYAVTAPTRSYYTRDPALFEGLDEEPPPVVKPGKDSVAVQPIWFTVAVPENAKPGDYTGSAVIKAQGEEKTAVTLRLSVADWKMPDSNDFFGFIGSFQSPETLSRYYDVPMWSDRHWELIETSFKRMAEIGVKDIYVTAIRNTHLGNENSMIRYVKGADGTLKPDLDIAKRYLDTGIKHLGKVPVVCIYTWETFNSAGKVHFGHHARKDRPILISVLDPSTGTLSKTEGPAWGTPECTEFWKKIYTGIREHLAEKNMQDSLMAGIAGDFEPTGACLENISQASGGVNWVFNSHVVRHAIGPKRKHPTGYIAAAWGGHARLKDPSEGRGYGWKNPFSRVQTRGFPGSHIDQRYFVEKLVCSIISRKWKKDKPDYGLHGTGRHGADFWPVLGGKRGRKKRLIARYSETRWGQLSVNLWMPALFAPGKNGTIHTIRTEMLRENQQEIEARIFLEKILCDSAQKEKLSAELAEKARTILDTRVRMFLLRYQGRTLMGPSWQTASRELYEIAAEAAKAVK